MSRSSFITRLRSRSAGFGSARGGSVHTIFALSALPMLAFIGAAVDYGRAAASQAKLQQAADGAVLAVAKLAQEGMATSEIKTRAQSFLSASSPGLSATISAGPTISADKSQVCIDAVASVDTAVMKIVHINAVPLHVTTCAAMADQTFEVALVLDTTGSMASSYNGVSKIQSLRSAANGFIDYMFTSATMKTRTKISIVPFSEAVAVDPATYRTAAWLDQTGASPEHWRSWLRTTHISSTQAPTSRWDVYNWLKAKRSAWDWGGCIESRAYPYNTQDVAPTTATPATLFVPALSPDEYDSSSSPAPYANNYIEDNGSSCTSSSNNVTTRQWRACKYRNASVVSTSSSRGPNTICSTRPLMRLTDQSATLKTLVNSLAAEGSTNVHEGLAWGWRTISPRGPFSDAKAYDTQNNNKIIVLMTDGANTWSADSSAAINESYYSAYGYYTNSSTRLPSGHTNVSTNSQARAAIDQLTRETCANVRAAGVKIYTIGFSVPNDPIDSQGLQLLRDCAGSTDRSFVATDGNELVRIFQEIAVGIGKLRLAR
ncbi:MAG TPA: TadE/TadG family type IV pilus assembly protein [Beijerinckiaceae bacterium]